MHDLLPDAKLVYVVRDPIRRIESHYVHALGAGKIRTDFDEAVADPEQSKLVQTSRYWWQLSAFLELYPAEQIRIIDYDRLSERPEEVVDEVLEFVGLEPGFRHPIFGTRIHVASNKMRPNRLGLMFWEDRTTRRRLQRAVPWLVCRPIERPRWDPVVLERVQAYLADDAAALRRFAGQSFDDWQV